MAGGPVFNSACNAGSESAMSVQRSAAHAIPKHATARVRDDAAWVASQASHVKIDSAAVIRSANRLQISEADRIFTHEWDEGNPETIRPQNSDRERLCAF